MRCCSIFFSLLFLLIPFAAFSQNQKIVDSLLKIVNNEKSHDTTKIKAYNDLGFEHGSSKPAQAKAYINSALRIAQNIERPRGVAGAYNTMGIVFYYQKQLDSAQYYFEKAYEINLGLEHEWGQASALNQIGVVQKHRDLHYDAIQSFRKAGVIFEGLQDTLSFAKSKENIGVVYSRMGHKQKSTEFYFEAIKLYNQVKNRTGIENSYRRLSSILFNQKDYQKALEYSNQLQVMLEKDNQSFYLSSLMQTKGECYLELKEYDKAIYHFQEALKHKQALGNQKNLSSVLNNLGKVYYEIGDYKKSLDFLKQSEENHQQKTNERAKAITYNSMAKTLLTLGQKSKAKEQAYKALKISKEFNNIAGEKEANNNLALIEESIGDTSKALMHFKEYHRLNDSINGIEKENRISELQALYDVEKKEQEIHNQKNEIALLKIEGKNGNLQKGLLGLGLLLSFLGIYALRQKNKRTKLEKQKVESDLEFKTKELTTHALHLAKKNEVLNDLKQKAKTLKEDSVESNGYQMLIQTINFDLQDDNNWENFSRYFEQVHKDFNSKAQEKYPNITTNDIRFMSLLRMNLSSKEIANILNISGDGVKKARQRLRKKLGITSEESLEAQIIAI